MATSVNIDPLTRIEGHLAIHVEVEKNQVIEARCSGEMFRGFEAILKGRDPLDAQQITQRICGVCPVSHGVASVLAQEKAYHAEPTENGWLVRNIILAANYIQSHLTHFYHLSALDFLDIKAVLQYQGKDSALNHLKAWVLSELDSNRIFPAAPFLPRYEGKYLKDVSAIKHYLDALDMRATAHQLGAVFAGKLPHFAAIVPGGVTEKVNAEKIATCLSLTKKLQTFIDDAYIEDLYAVAGAFPEYYHQGRGTGNFLAYGVFQESADGDKTLLPPGVIIQGKHSGLDIAQIVEETKYSQYQNGPAKHPSQGTTIPDPDKAGAYSWIKAPRYQANVMEVGPLARVMVARSHDNQSKVSRAVDTALKKTGRKVSDLDSVLGRHLARALECKIVAERCREWIEMLKPGEPTFRDFEIPETGQGVGLTEAPRGALGHWLTIKDYKIDHYQCVVPTTWNCSPRDDKGNPGVIEQALVATPIADRNNPIEATRVVRSFDPCIACAVH